MEALGHSTQWAVKDSQANEGQRLHRPGAGKGVVVSRAMFEMKGGCNQGLLSLKMSLGLSLPGFSLLCGATPCAEQVLSRSRAESAIPIKPLPTIT